MGAIQNIIDDIATLLLKIAERIDELDVSLVDNMEDGDGHECDVDSIYILLRASEVLTQGNNTDDQNEKVADRALLEKIGTLPGNPVAGYPSFTLNVT